MAASAVPRYLDVRPVHGLTRSRSSTTPTRLPADAAVVAPPNRPSHVRSQSYISSEEPKPLAGAATFHTMPTNKDTEKPSESKFHRLHLPGRHHHQEKPGSIDDRKSSTNSNHGRRHRYTQSESQQYHRQKRASADTAQPPSITTTPAPLEQSNDMLYPSSRGAAIPSLIRMASHRSFRGSTSNSEQASSNDLARTNTGASEVGEKSKRLGGLRRRATSDPRAPSTHPHIQHLQSQHPFPSSPLNPNFPNHSQLLQPIPDRPHATEIDDQLEKSEYLRSHRLLHATNKDITALTHTLEASNDHLQSRLQNSTRTASDLMRRLDDAHATLQSTSDSLIDTISSFTTLCTNNERLIHNFSRETHHLDASTRNRISSLRNNLLTNRQKKVEALEERGKNMSTKAEELGRRLENCRTIIKNWEVREGERRRAWQGVWKGLMWGFVVILSSIILGIVKWKVGVGGGGGGDVMAGPGLEGRWAIDRAVGMMRKKVEHNAEIMGLDHEIVKINVHHDDQSDAELNTNTDNDDENEKKIEDEININVPEEVKKILADIAVRNTEAARSAEAKHARSLSIDHIDEEDRGMFENELHRIDDGVRGRSEDKALEKMRIFDEL